MCASVCVVPVQDFSPALLCQFLFRYECYCVSLMERLHSSSGLGNGVCFSDGTTIYGVLWLSPAGLLLHCIPGRYSPDMAQKITGYIKLQIPAGKATPAPPVGPALGQHGVNIMAFTKEFNERTKNDAGLIIPVVITVYADRSFTFITKTPPAAVLIKKACGIDKASGVPNKNKVAKITKEQVQKIAETKMPDLNAASLEAAMSMIAGTARSMGITVED